MVKSVDSLDPERWGLPKKSSRCLTRKLRRTLREYQASFKTRTGNSSGYAEIYMKGLLLMDCKRNYANIARRVVGPEEDGQDIQQFMSDSPWDGQRVYDQIQGDISRHPELRGGALILDESAFERDGDQSAGAARQHLGRFGKVDLGQVGVGLCYYKNHTWAMVDAQLYMPEVWFDETHADLRRRHHVPENLKFRTKTEIGLEAIRRAKANGLPFEVVLADSSYGRNHKFRKDLDKEGMTYVADILANMKVYTERPTVGIPEKAEGAKGPDFTRPRVLSGHVSVEVWTLAGHPDTKFETVEIRESERGVLSTKAAARRVWTVSDEGEVREEWLLIWDKPNDKTGYSLSNEPPDTPLRQLVVHRAQRYFIERAIEDQKSENGWDEFMARKYRAWHHHAAMEALTLWFIAETKLEFQRDFPRDPELKKEFELEVLPALSTANVRELLRSAMPLQQLSEKEALFLVTKHLVNRSRSMSSRRKNRRRARSP